MEEIAYETDTEILSFVGSGKLWLCDDYSFPMEVGGIVYPSIRHRMLAQKTKDIEVRKLIAKTLPADLKDLERSLEPPDYWNKNFVLESMYFYTKEKFKDEELKAKLQATYPKKLTNNLPIGKGLLRREIDEICNEYDYAAILERVRYESIKWSK